MRDQDVHCAADWSNYGFDCSPALLHTKTAIWYDSSVEICAVLMLENICQVNFKDQLKAADGSFVHDYTVGDTLEIPVPVTYTDSACTVASTMTETYVDPATPADFFQKVGLNYRVSLTDPSTFTQYATSNGQIVQISIQENAPTG